MEETVLDKVLQTLTEIREELEAIKVTQEEIIEKLANLNTPGVDFGFEE